MVGGRSFESGGVGYLVRIKISYFFSLRAFIKFIIEIINLFIFCQIIFIIFNFLLNTEIKNFVIFTFPLNF